MSINNTEKELWKSTKKKVITDSTSINDNCSIRFGPYYTSNINLDIKHLPITLARYKFINKLFRFKENYSLLELGCSEGIGCSFFIQAKNCSSYQGVDFDDKAISFAKTAYTNKKINFIEDDFLNKQYGIYDIVISIDVIEHINQKKEKEFLNTIYNNLDSNGTAIIGTPNISMAPHTSEANRLAHINLFSQERLYHLCKNKFHSVYIFNMNDEIIHTGMDEMSCYMFAICAGKKE